MHLCGAKMINDMRLKNTNFRFGDIYLFHPTDARCNSATSLWGVYDRTNPDGRIRLETATHDLCHFSRPTLLPGGYRFCRRATRAELRDFYFNLGCNRK